MAKKKGKGEAKRATQPASANLGATTAAETKQPTIREIGAASLKPVGAGVNFTEFARVPDGATVVVTPKATIVKTHPLDVMHHRGRIEQDEYDAGVKLMIQHHLAFGSRGYQSVNLSGIHGVSNYSDNWRITQPQADALADLRGIEKFFSLAEWQMLVGVCYKGLWPSELARQCSVSPKYVRLYFRACLRALSEVQRTNRRTTMAPAHGEGQMLQ